MKTNLKKVQDKIHKGWILCAKMEYGIPRYSFIRNGKISKYPRINEEIFCDEIHGNVDYRRYGYIKGVQFEEIAAK